LFLARLSDEEFDKEWLHCGPPAAALDRDAAVTEENRLVRLPTTQHALRVVAQLSRADVSAANDRAVAGRPRR
jgi:hypothetical protein